jgi:ABC-type glutathione transport system ATPase component
MRERCARARRLPDGVPGPLRLAGPAPPVLQTVAEPLAVLHGASPAEQRERAAEVLDAVGLRAGDLASTRTSSPAASASASPSHAR